MMEDETPEVVAPIEVAGTGAFGANDIVPDVTRNADVAIESGNEKNGAGAAAEDDHIYPPLSKIISVSIALAMIILLVCGTG
jgi:hypothetical protein